MKRKLLIASISLIVGCGDAVEVCGALGRELSPLPLSPGSWDNANWDRATFGDINADGHADLILASYARLDSPSEQWCYLGGSAGLETLTSWIGDSSFALGAGLAAGGDVNGDGYDDLIVGGSPYDGLGPVLFLGSNGGLSSTPTMHFERPNLGSVAFQDVDCDGIDELVFGVLAPAFPDRAAAEVHKWTATNTLELLSSVSVPGQSAEFRAPAIAVGDVTGDGCGDVLVIGHDSGILQPELEKTALFLGGPDGLSSEPVWAAGNGLAGFEKVFDATGIGDVDGDGLGDILMLGVTSATRELRLFSFRGTRSGLSSEATWVASVPVLDNFWLGPTGDINGDGRLDVFSPLDLLDHPGLDAPELYLAQDGLPPGPFADMSPLSFGAVATGDVNGDGCDDFVNRTKLYAGGHP